MLANEMYQFRDDLASRGIIFCYSGYMTEETLTGIGSAIRKKLELENAERKRAKSVFAIFVEQIQNVIRYSAERAEQADSEPDDNLTLRYGVLTVGQHNDKYFVSCGNMIVKKDVERLRSSLDHISSLDSQGLKNLYKETLRGEVPEGSKGAGVGFIDIARKAEKGFEYDFEPLDPEHSYFCLKAYI